MFKKALNHKLREDEVSISEVFFLHEKFLNKYAVSQKQYEYVVQAGLGDDRDNVFLRVTNSLCLEHKIDTDKLQRACQLFEGKHNFKQFTAAKLAQKEEEGYSFVKTVDSVEAKVEKVEMYVCFDDQIWERRTEDCDHVQSEGVSAVSGPNDGRSLAADWEGHLTGG